MSGWLPITVRNRVALSFAALALLMFVVWNCLPHYEYGETKPHGIVATSLWPEIVRPDLYIWVLRDRDLRGFLSIAACMALIQNALVTLAAVPFWKLLHASSYIRLPLATANLLGGCLVLWFIAQRYGDAPPPYWLTMMTLIALGMFAISAALFIFKNELALREERGRPQAG
jgi:hypothetical protein